jgi:hypothetical protein
VASKSQYTWCERLSQLRARIFHRGIHIWMCYPLRIGNSPAESSAPRQRYDSKRLSLVCFLFRIFEIDKASDICSIRQ